MKISKFASIAALTALIAVALPQTFAPQASAAEIAWSSNYGLGNGVFDDFGNVYLIRAGGVWGNGGLSIEKIAAGVDGSGNPTGLGGARSVLYSEPEANRTLDINGGFNTCASQFGVSGSGINGCAGPKSAVGISDHNTYANWVKYGASIAWADTHTLLIGDSDIAKVFKFDLDTGIFWTFIDNTVVNNAHYGDANFYDWYQDVVGAPKFRFLAADNDGIPMTASQNKVYTYDPTEPLKFKVVYINDPNLGAPTTDRNGIGAASNTWCHYINGFTVDPSGNAYLGCNNQDNWGSAYDSVVKLTPTISGGVTTYTPTLHGHVASNGSWLVVTSDAKGQIFVGSQNLSYSFLISNGTVTSSPLSYGASWILFDRAGNLYYSASDGNIRKSSGQGYAYPPRGVLAGSRPQSAYISWLSPGVTGIETYTATSTPVNSAADPSGAKTCVSIKPANALTPAFNCSINGLINGVTYAVSLIATTAKGDSLPTSTYLVTPLDVPSAPTIDSVSLSSNTSVNVTYSAPTNNGGADVESYTVTSTPDSITAYVQGAIGGTANLSGLRPGITYSFAVKAGNSQGLSPSSNNLTQKIAKAPTFNSWSNISKNKSDAPFLLIAPSESDTASGSFIFTSSNAGIVSITGETATVVQAGSAVITATFYPTDTSTYLSGITKTMTVSVSAASNAITFGALSSRAVTAGSFNLTATATGGVVTYSSSTSAGTCAVTNGGVVSMFSPGTCVITASSLGNANYGAATDVTQNLVITAAPPGAPTLTSVSVGGTDAGVATSGYATVQFTANTENGGSITSYVITATPATGSAITKTVTAGSGTRTDSITALTLGQAYSFTVTAYNGGTTGGGTSAASNAVTKTPAANPNAPTNLRVTSGDTTLTANWTPPVSLGGGTWDSYRIFLKPSADASFSDTPTAIIGTQATSTYQFTGLTNGVAYDVKIWVKTTSFTTELLANTAAVYLIPATVPTAPRLALAQTDTTTVVASWSSNGDGGSILTGYTLTLNSGACSFSFVSGTTSYSCPITGLTTGTTVTASLIATNGVGSSASATATVNYVSLVGAPTSLVSTSGDGQVSISFAIANNGDTVVSYDYSIDGLSYSPLNATSSPISITGLTNDQLYNIYLRARGATYGEGPTSAPVTATPRRVVVNTAPFVVVEPTFSVIAYPAIAATKSGFTCSAGRYLFNKSGYLPVNATPQSFTYSLLSNNLIVDSGTSLTNEYSFSVLTVKEDSTFTCAVLISQEDATGKFVSAENLIVAEINKAQRDAYSKANDVYQVDRDKAYRLKTDETTAVIALWRKAMDAALDKRSAAIEKADAEMRGALEKSGVSIYRGGTTVEKPPVVIIKEPVTENVQPSKTMQKVGTIYFANGTYFINDASRKAILAIANKIQSSSATKVLSYGHTDVTKGVDNKLLSKNRARAVAKILRTIVKGKSLNVGWYASSKPVSTGTSKADLAKNRRVEIYVK